KFEKFWSYVIKYREIYLGNYVIINGSLKCNNGSKLGKKGEVLAGIITLTFKKDPIDKMIEMRITDTSSTMLITDLAPDELLKTQEGANIIKKVVKDFGKISEFENYLEKIHYKDFA
ncbi:MAG: hypothetical protein ACFFAO_10085, partial [Candidatus Hermodarchaeota archaeon]